MKIHCSISVVEENGELKVVAAVPSGAETTVAGQSIAHLACMAHHMMDFALAYKETPDGLASPKTH